MAALEVTGSSITKGRNVSRREKFIDSIVWNVCFMCLYIF